MRVLKNIRTLRLIANHTILNMFNNVRIAQSVPRAVMQAELALSIQNACHAPLQTIDHLSEVIAKNSSKAGAMSKLKLHRTKCTALITNVVSPSLHEELKRGVAGKIYSLLFDDSQDIALHKHTVIATKYFDNEQQAVVDAYLGLMRCKRRGSLMRI